MLEKFKIVICILFLAFAAYFFVEVLKILIESQQSFTYEVEITNVTIQNSIEGDETKRYYVAYKVIDDKGKQLVEMPTDKTVVYDILDSNEAYAEIKETGSGDIISVKLYVHDLPPLN